MKILSVSVQNLQNSPLSGKDEYDCTSEPFVKPKLSSTTVNMIKTLRTIEKCLQKQNITLDTSKHIIRDLATELYRVTTKVLGQSQAYNMVDDLSVKECEVFIIRWSEELKCLKSAYKDNHGKFSNVERFRRSLEGLNITENQVQKLREAQKDFHWLIHILQSLPKSSVCLEECARVEDLYRQWKKGQLINMLPIMDFIMKTLLKEKDSSLKQRLQHRSARWKKG
ncbi:uncharacterized protein LOC127171152 isoform X3 [Labeo rohita]|uniref:uncharacterized protein LOC127171152 isoform X3 n=1 Tax=Labeo rohita TaxID=84645 RepID=UPI0021E2F3B1|nr:uncharacterized protein LOC127171152 isoform X3 [Labeo rohita]